jgi:hypothetical protein
MAVIVGPIPNTAGSPPHPILTRGHNSANGVIALYLSAQPDCFFCQALTQETP